MLPGVDYRLVNGLKGEASLGEFGMIAWPLGNVGEICLEEKVGDGRRAGG